VHPAGQVFFEVHAPQFDELHPPPTVGVGAGGSGVGAGTGALELQTFHLLFHVQLDPLD
jgi:hypothetical protein